jgi:hypothetical protein
MKRIALLVAASMGALAPAAAASDDGIAWDEPAPCYDNADCLEGFFCDVPIGTCIETGFCQTDWECPDGLVCDERNTCIPEEPPPPIPACETLQTELECLSRADCSPVYILVRCSCDGGPCTGAGCACERYEFAGCSSL